MTRTEYSKRRFVLAATEREMTVEEFVAQFGAAVDGRFLILVWMVDVMEEMHEEGWEPFLHYDPGQSGQILCWRRQVEATDAE